ncbi:MAG: hypothetical protein ACM3N4_03050 [Nitrososphaerota archaeon]
MLKLIERTPHEDRVASDDRVILADGSVVTVPRANLAAAKGLLAAERAAQRRADARRAREAGNKQSFAS